MKSPGDAMSLNAQVSDVLVRAVVVAVPVKVVTVMLKKAAAMAMAKAEVTAAVIDVHRVQLHPPLKCGRSPRHPRCLERLAPWPHRTGRFGS
jgi:hypothetical protein